MINQIKKDIFSSNAEEYWKNEGCNSRMINYIKVFRFFRIVRLFALFLVVAYIVYISSVSIILGVKSIDNPIKLLINIYQISFVGLILLSLINYKVRFDSLYYLINNIIKSCIVLPIIALIMFYFCLVGNLIMTFWIIILYFLFDFVMNEFNKRIFLLWAVSKGTEKNNLDD